MEYLDKLLIARQAYYDINQVIDKYENTEKQSVWFCWDGCIQVDDELFHEHQIRQTKEVL